MKDRAKNIALLFIGVGFLFALSGCVVGSLAEKAASVVAKPVFGLAVKDAQTTLTWVDREVESGGLSPWAAEAAKRCPEAVIALDMLRTRMSESADKVDGFRGLIYYGTRNKFGQSVQVEAGEYLKQVAQECLPLVPAEKLIKLF